MRRLLGSMLALALLTVAGAAQAGLRAVYLDINSAKRLQIDVFDNGDARIAEVGSSAYGLMIGGDFYIVDTTGGKPTVARLKDVATAIDTVLPPIFKGLFDGTPGTMPATHLTFEKGEPGNAGGRDGVVYHVKGLDAAKPDKAADYLINQDDDLKPVGAALEGFMNAAVVPSAPLIGAGAVELIAETRAIFALGTPIDVGGRFRLNLAVKAALPAGYFRLPAPAQTVDQLVAAMKESMKAAPAK